MRKSNYDVMKEEMQKKFVKYDQNRMIRKFGLKFDAQYLYIQLVGREYRIDRNEGKVEWIMEEGSFVDASYDEAMSIYDVLCGSKEDAHLSNEFTTLGSLPGIIRGIGLDNKLFQKEAQCFDHRMNELASACEALGGIREEKGDVSYRIPAFPFLPVILQFWESDEDFPASLQFLWDKNILDYMHYETTFYVVNQILYRLQEIMNENNCV